MILVIVADNVVELVDTGLIIGDGLLAAHHILTDIKRDYLSAWRNQEGVISLAVNDMQSHLPLPWRPTRDGRR
jgi:hypothetical protein